MNVNLSDAHALEDELSLLSNVPGIRISCNFQFHTPNKMIGTKGPKMWFLNRVHSLQLHQSLVAGWKLMVQLFGLTLHQHQNGFFDQGKNGERDEDGDKHGANWIGNHPPKSPHEDSTNNHTYGAQSVCQYVEKHSLHDLGIS